MICNSCKKEFDNINGLKFCPYCGGKIEEEIILDINEIVEEIHDGGEENINEDTATEKFKRDTLKMPVITEDDIAKFNRNKIFINLKNRFIQKKVIVPIVTVLVIMVIGLFGYKFLLAKPVDAARVNEDLIGKIVTLPKGTNIEIKKSYIKSCSINKRNTDKSKDDLQVAVTLNNSVVQVKTLLSMTYINQGKNKWELSGKVSIIGEAEIKPVVAMDEKQFLDELKKLTISISNEPMLLSGKNVKSLNVNLRTPDLEKGKEEVLVAVGLDSGLLTATGNIKCQLNFENEKWSIATIERNSTEDFTVALSPSFSQESIIETVNKEGLDETVTFKDLFGGKGFNVKDSFTKSITISDKKFDGQNKTLTATAKRVNNAGEIKSTLLTDYTFSLSFSSIALVNKSKTTVFSAAVNEISNDLIISTIANVYIEGGNVLFWFPDNHKITTEESKTFKSTEILSKKGFNNIKYIYANINYINGKMTKAVSVVAIYFLVYDSSKGYTWSLDKVVGEDSPNYKTYSKASINK